MITAITHPTRKKIILGIGAAALLGGLFLTFGGDTLDRFRKGDNVQELKADYRNLIFEDTVSMTKKHPIFGVGLAGFPQVFPLFRERTAFQNQMIHPESDWLWLASEVGWPGTLFVFFACCWLIWRAFYGAIKRPHPLRLTSAICGALFVLHGLFDVSAHRFGTLIPACFLFCLFWPGQRLEVPVSPKRSRFIALGLVLVATGWFMNTDTPPLWPSRSALAVAKQAAALQIEHGNGAAAFGMRLWTGSFITSAARAGCCKTGSGLRLCGIIRQRIF